MTTPPPTHEDAVRRLENIEQLLWDAQLLAQTAVFEATRLDLQTTLPEIDAQRRRTMVIAIMETFERIESARDDVDSLQCDHRRGVIA